MEVVILLGHAGQFEVIQLKKVQVLPTIPNGNVGELISCDLFLKRLC